MSAPKSVARGRDRGVRSDVMTPKMKDAIDAMVWDGLSYRQAAEKTGIQIATMRDMLSRPRVLAYHREQRQMLLSSEGIRTIHRMIAIRDTAANMPAVTAGRVLLDLEAEQRASTPGGASSPGVTIHINGMQADAEPRAVGHAGSVNEGRPATNRQLITIDQPPGLDADDEP